MIIVGLTGGIGAGKSFVANEFQKKGIPVYNSDMRAKELMESHTILKKELIQKFGSTVYNNGKLNRKLIADQIFTDKTLLEWMNGLIHPIVQNDFESWLRMQKVAFVIKEAAILIESGAHKQCNKIIVVTSPENLRIKRVILRDKLTPEQVAERIKNQMSDVDRLKYADYTLFNDDTSIVSEQIERIYKALLEFSATLSKS